MSEVLTKTIIDCTSNTVEIVPLTAEEIAQREAEQAINLAMEAERVAQAQALAILKASAKAKLIAGTPLTAEEADTLII